MNRTVVWLLGSLAGSAGVATVVALLHQGHGQKSNLSVLSSPDLPRKAAGTDELQSLIDRKSGSPDPIDQEEVGKTRVRLGFLHAKSGDFNLARATFKEAEQNYRGTHQVDAAFGGVQDQAAYQAAACLSAQHKDAEAKAEFETFLTRYPYSPLVHAVYKRLTKMDPDHTDDYARLLQKDVDLQVTRSRLEGSMCGPKTVAYLLPLLGKPSVSYKDVAKVAGTGADGTTLQSLRAALKAYGVESYGYKVNRQDLAKMPLPAVAVEFDHYVALTEVASDHAVVFDPRTGTKATKPLPPLDDPDFSLAVLTFQQLNLP